RIGEHSPEFVAEHSIDGTAIFPATAYLEMALAAGRELFGSETLVLEQVSIERAMPFAPDEVKTVQLLVRGSRFEIFSLAGSEWILHCSGTVTPSAKTAADQSLDAVRARSGSELSAAEHYAEAERRGVRFGPRFRGIERMWRADDGALVKVRRPDTVERDGYLFHPAVFDASLQGVSIAAASAGGEAADVPVAVERMRVFGPPSDNLWSHIRSRTPGLFDVSLYSEDGTLTAVLEGLAIQRVRRSALITDTLQRSLYNIEWLAAPPERNADSASGRRIIVKDDNVEESDVAEVVHLCNEPRTVLHLMQNIAQWNQKPRLVLVTRGATPAGPGGDVANLEQSPIWG